MAQLFFADLVREKSGASGLGPLALEGALPGHRAFADAVPAGARFHYSVAGITRPQEWEVGEGTIDAEGRLVRMPLASSAGGALVDFDAGLKTIALTVAAHWFAERDGLDAITIGDVNGLSDALAAKQAAGNYQPAGSYQAAGNYALADHVHAYLPSIGGSISGSLTVAGNNAAREALDVNGAIAGGFGARTSGGVIDWNDVSNARAGNGVSLLQGAASNGPAEAGTRYFHSFSFEFNSKNGSGNMTQFAIPYSTGSALGALYMRGRYSNAWGGWSQILSDNLSGQFAPGADNNKALGAPTRRFSVVYAGTGAINTSDARDKKHIGDIPGAWLDAWGDVDWQRYRFKQVGTGKGQKGRWHVGLVAQAVHSAFAARGLDAFELGLLCRDAWDEEREPVMAKRSGKMMPHRTRQVQAAGDRWGLRYDECFAMEAAWVRRELARLAQL